MEIQMIGIDYLRANVDIRSVFSFTRKSLQEALREWKALPGIRGCILLSTCNRMELWVSQEDQEGQEYSLLDVLCRFKEVNPGKYRTYFVEREGKEAVRHLFMLTAGLKSRILAEDQILSQVKTALSLAREEYCTDNVLEVLFRTAVTAAKIIKTEVVFTHASETAMDRAILKLKKEGISLKGKPCMVIGNGEMGKLAAMTLQKEGADVTVTVRQYRSGEVQIPAGCRRINYGDRMKLFPSCDLIVSATSSPNYTIRRELFSDADDIGSSKVLIDLAVPRDIEPSVGDLPGFVLYDIDDFSVTAEEENKAALEKAETILQEEMDTFYVWYDCRDLIPRIQKLQDEAVEDLNLRISKILRALPISEKEQQTFQKQMDTAAGKVVAKMVYGLRDFLSIDEFRTSLEGLEKVYEEG